MRCVREATFLPLPHPRPSPFNHAIYTYERGYAYVLCSCVLMYVRVRPREQFLLRAELSRPWFLRQSWHSKGIAVRYAGTVPIVSVTVASAGRRMLMSHGIGLCRLGSCGWSAAAIVLAMVVVMVRRFQWRRLWRRCALYDCVCVCVCECVSVCLCVYVCVCMVRRR